MSRRLHRAQYVLGPAPVSFGPDWRQVEVADGRVLSHDPALRVGGATDRSGRRWWLLGVAVETGGTRAAPLEALREHDGGDPVALTDGWAGRWLLTDGARLYPDASALLPCHVLRGEDGTWATSSPSLARRLAGEAPGEGAGDPDPRGVRHGRLNWFPPPLARRSPARRVLASQSLELEDGSVAPLRLGPTPPPAGYDRTLQELQDRLVTGIARASGDADVHLPLSAGFDSRLVLAAALDAGVRPRCFTFRKRPQARRDDGRPTTNPALRADMRLPPRIAKAAGLEHRWIPAGDFSEEALATFDAQCDGECIENDRFYESHGQWGWAPDGAVLLRGGVFEVGHCFYWERLPELEPHDERGMHEALVEGFGLEPGSPHAVSLGEWCAWAARTPGSVPVRDWRDRFYVEQRAGGWLATLEQALDLVPGTRFYAANCRAVFRLLDALPAEKRASLRHQVDLIGRLAPELLAIPINPPDPAWYRVSRKVRTKAEQWARMSPRAALRDAAHLARKYLAARGAR